ncbi:MAG: ABC transporter ATP-binding protein [Anaerolineae bacterium]
MRILLRLLGYLKSYWRRALATYFCLLAVTLLGLIIPWLIKLAIDVGLAGGEGRFLVLAALIVVGVSLVKALFSFGQRYLSEWLSHRVAYDLRNDLYDHIQRLSLAYHDRAQTGQLMSRATNDVESVQRFVSIGLMDSINATLLLLSILVILLSTDRHLALVALAPLPFVALFASRLGRLLRPMFHLIQQQLARTSTILQENLAGVQVVKAFAREDHEIEKFAAANRELMEQRLIIVRLWASNFPLMAFVIGMGTALILWFGGRRVVDGELSVGTLVAFNSYLVMLAMPIQRLGWLVNIAAGAMASGERIFEILDAESRVKEKPKAVELPPLEGWVRFENVSFSYDSSGLVLDDISLEAKPGQVVALMGATGSGKSTIINLIPRFYDVTAGRVTIDGYDVRDVTLKSLRRQIGLVLQESLLFSATIRENITYGHPEASLEEIVAAAKAAKAHDFITAFPDGYETLVGERGITLSGGQRQRVAIARALLMDPRILILDDSTSSVDTETEYLIQQALAAFMKGRTTFVIAQRLTTVVNADRILVLADGHIAEEGTHEELLALGGLYKEIYDLQLKDQERLRKEILCLEEEVERQPTWCKPVEVRTVAGIDMEGNL